MKHVFEALNDVIADLKDDCKTHEAMAKRLYAENEKLKSEVSCLKSEIYELRKEC
jgi:chaperonin cofactor prefoldin